MVIVFGPKLFDINTLERPTWHVNSFIVNSFYDRIQVSLEHHGTMEIKQVQMTVEHALEIGLINLDALKSYLK